MNRKKTILRTKALCLLLCCMVLQLAACAPKQKIPEIKAEYYPQCVQPFKELAEAQRALVTRTVASAALGAAGGAIIGALTTGNWKGALAGGIAGGVVAGTVGYSTGKQQQIADVQERLRSYRTDMRTDIRNMSRVELYSMLSLQCYIREFRGLLAQYNEKSAALPPLEAEEKAAAKLLAKEPETKALSRGMSREALWNFVSSSEAGAAKQNPAALNVSDEIQNSLYQQLKERRSGAEIRIASLRASIKDLRARIDKTQKEYAALNARILAAETEVARLQRERATLQESYAALSKQYQRSRVATVEATDPIKIVEKPIVPREPVSRGGLKILCLAGLLGLFMGTTAALVAEMFAKRAEAKA